jgi:hypothetical protein
MLALVAGISIKMARLCRNYHDHRVEPGGDVE